MNAAGRKEQRRHERIRLSPMYTNVTVQRVDGLYLRSIEGHAYDISESGARIELDEAIEPGERVAMCLRLPGSTTSIFASGRVIWKHDDEDDPGARRMAVQFTRFLNVDDRARLVRYLGSSGKRLAA